MIIVAADHGEEFLDPHPDDTGGWSHGRTLYIEQLHVPLIVSLPGDAERGRVIEQPVELVEVAPTILDIAGLSTRTPAVFRGRSLSPLMQGQLLPERPSYSGGNHGGVAVLGKGLMYYRYDKDTKTHRRYYGLRPPEGYESRTGEELYDLADDPTEISDLKQRTGAADKELRAAARALQQLGTDWLARGAGAEGGGAMELQADEVENLRALGYLQGTVDDGAGSPRK